MLREAQVMAALKTAYPHVPQILARCDDAAVLGSDFYVMERSARHHPAARAAAARSASTKPACASSAAASSIAWSSCTGRCQRSPQLAALGKGEGYIARQVGGWSERWRKALTDGSDPCEDVLAWLARTAARAARRRSA